MWQMQSFTPAVSWSLIRDAHGHWVRRIVCAVAPEVDGSPVSYGAESPLPADGEHGQLLSALQSLSLQPFEQPQFLGMDGCIYGVSSGGFWVNANLSWWESAPPSWQALADWHARACRVLNANLPASSLPLDLRGSD